MLETMRFTSTLFRLRIRSLDETHFSDTGSFGVFYET